MRRIEQINPEPTPHAIIDEATDLDLIEEVASVWPAPDWVGWHAVYRQAHQQKRACNLWESMPAPCRRLLTDLLFLDVSPFNLGPLVPDTSLWGGGMHDLGDGGVLGLHLDADHHPLNGLRRRLNAVLFLNPTWDTSWGGALELWDTGRTRPAVEILPAPGRLVIFETTSTSWHGIPRPLACPTEVRRMTLACWWYGPAVADSERPRALFL